MSKKYTLLSIDGSSFELEEKIIRESVTLSHLLDGILKKNINFIFWNAN